MDKLSDTLYCQPAVVVTSLAAVERLKEESPRAINNCIATAGFSVGEISALIFSGALTFEHGTVFKFCASLCGYKCYVAAAQTVNTSIRSVQLPRCSPEFIKNRLYFFIIFYIGDVYTVLGVAIAYCRLFKNNFHLMFFQV